jgi:hypothetical protein
MSGDQVAQGQKVKTRRKGCGVLLRLALLGFLLLAVPAVAYLFFMLRAGNLVRAELEKIRAAGEPVSAEDLDAYYEYPPLEEDATQLWLAALKPLDGPAYSEACGELPIVGYSEEEKVVCPISLTNWCPSFSTRSLWIPSTAARCATSCERMNTLSTASAKTASTTAGRKMSSWVTSIVQTSSSP